MSKKCVLLVHADGLVSNFFREKLEGAGLEVIGAASGEAALATFQDGAPDLVLLDLVLAPPGMTGVEFLRAIRKLSQQVPIFGLPGATPTLISAATQAGVTKMLPPVSNVVYQMLSTVRQALGGTGAPPPLAGEIHPAPVLLGSASDLVNALRLELRAVAKSPANPEALARLGQLVHALSQRIAVVGLMALNRLTVALELLLFDLRQTPEGINDSTLRTIGQTADFVARLLSESAGAKLSDPGMARVCTIDDELLAREIIVRTMLMAGLKSVGVGTPAEGLALLEKERFELIFLDVSLPEMSGFELCKKVRLLPFHAATPIVFVTGMATFQNRAQGSLSGGNDFVGKPFNLAELGVKALLWIFKAQLGEK